MAVLGREDDRDTRGDPEDDDEDDDGPAQKGKAAPVVPGTAAPTEGSLNHGETLAPNKLLAIAADPLLDAPAAAAPAGGAAASSSSSSSSPLSPTPAAAATRLAPGSNSHARQVSTGESLWSLHQSDSDSSDDDVGFETPDEGLSEVGEEDEEASADLHGAATAPPAVKSISDGAASPSVLPSAVNGTAAAAVAIPAADDDADLALSRVKSNPVPDMYHASPSVDQAAVLDVDLAMCHRVMGLFLNSHIAEAERVVKEGDPKRERLYYQVADAILCTLKVRLPCFAPAPKPRQRRRLTLDAVGRRAS